MSKVSTEKQPNTTRKRCLTADARRAMMDGTQSAKIRRNADRVKTPTLLTPWTSSSFWERSSILTCGNPNLKMNIENPMALCQVIFDNCVVKIREGIDLKNLLTLGRKGDVELTNVTSFGWVATERTLLPCCIFERWISDMGAAGIVLEGVPAGAAAAAVMIAFKPSD
jgi:hypothetical protein